MSIDLLLLVLTIAYAGFFAVVTEGLIEWFGGPIPRRFKAQAAALLATGLCVLFGVDVLQVAPPPYRLSGGIILFGQLCTGVCIGRLSNYLNDRWQRWLITDVPAAPVDAVLKDG